MVTSVSGLISRPKKGEYASAMAFFNRGRPYWVRLMRRFDMERKWYNTFVGEY